ncbi:SusD/RagB family nutrient-binding outer membrane lipoprotein [Flammeovirga sp. SJP92]|uniref:SusD/RagB family nutrient-binding outer membrane lipoprotein n=1 Tax=Flammeovirga sp. SJP92 TaxID=1775430 RepID=UPI000787527B|nr:SusD/RagB family nutrient-binding outer membrane lipoprotein [Flammeovirga sp. SJP92]KXX67736.1 hypothetical protein AVL50_25040 [Flammeovirga sp. SJP92]
MKKIFKNILVAAATVGAMSCSELVKDTNISPNSPTYAPASVVLPSSQLGLAMINEGDIARIAGIWSGYFSGSVLQYQPIHEYNVVAGDFDSAWDILYRVSYGNAKVAMEDAEERGNRILAGYCKIVMAYSLGIAADLWGDVPGAEAGKAIDGISTPVYDSQAEVFTAVQTLLDQAIEDIKSNEGVVSSDILNFSLEAAYSLKARYYMHTKNYDMALQNAQLGISSADQNVEIEHGTSLTINSNIYWTFCTVERPDYLTADNSFGVGYLEGRANAKTKTVHLSSYLYKEGTTYSHDLNVLEDGFFGQTSTFPLLTYRENVLTIAETSARANDLATALTKLNEYRSYMASGGYIDPLYHNVDGEALQYDAYTDADFDAGGMLNQDNISKADAYVREILAERYTALVGQLEGFSEMRRTYKDPLRVQITPNTGTQLPQRLLYPQVEINTNPNTPELVDVFTPTAVNQ